MKQTNKILFASVATLVISTGAGISYLRAQQPLSPQEELTLANIEALGRVEEGGAGTITCSGGDNKCAEAYDKAGNVIATLYMP